MDAGSQSLSGAKVKPFFFWLIFTAVLTALTLLTSFFPLWANVPINILLPIYVLFTLKMVMFERLKLSTLVIMRALIILVLFNLMSGELFVKLVLIFLIINILEAAFTDLLKNCQPYNFVSGIILGASVLTLAGRWIPEITGRWSGIYRAESGAMGSGIFTSDKVFIFATICWIIAYTLWNWIFVIGEFGPSVAYLHIGILLAPILGVVLTGVPGYWLVFRANSLTTGGVFQISRKSVVEQSLASPRMQRFCEKEKTAKVQVLLMIVNILLMAPSIIMYFMRRGF